MMEEEGKAMMSDMIRFICAAPQFYKHLTAAYLVQL